jgi:hypothetical protein
MTAIFSSIRSFAAALLLADRSVWPSLCDHDPSLPTQSTGLGEEMTHWDRWAGSGWTETSWTERAARLDLGVERRSVARRG